MKALVWHGKQDIRCDNVPDPEIEDPKDAIIKVTSCAICGSDLHLFHNMIPAMMPGDVVGHEMMGVVEEVGSEVTKLRKGDRIVIPFTINCDECDQCRRGNYLAVRAHQPQGRARRQGVRPPHRGPVRLHPPHRRLSRAARPNICASPSPTAPISRRRTSLTDEQLLFLGDIFPTGWQAAVQCDIQRTDVVAIWGAGPVGQMAIRSAILLGAKTVIAIDRLPERLSMAAAAGAETINFEDESVLERLNDLTEGKGPDKCIDAVGMEAHASSHLDGMIDRAKQAMLMVSDRAHVLREMIYVCRGGGVLSIPGVYSGLMDKVPFGMAMNKGLTFRMGQTHVRRWTDDLTRRIEEGQIDPSFVITHTAKLEEGPGMYRVFEQKQDSCVKVVLKP